MNRPPVTALLPVRNGEQWMPNAIDNLNRTLTPEDEIIIVDDGSTDKTMEIIKSGKFIAPLILLSSQSPGLVAALNLGITHSRNQWIARFDVDDFYFDNRLELQLENIQDEVVAVFSDFKIYTEARQYLGYIPSPLTHNGIYLSLLNSERNAHPSVIYRKDAVIQAGAYRDQDFPCEDLSLWLRLAKVGKLSGIPAPTLNYLLRKSSITGSRYLEAKAKTLLTLEEYFDSQFSLDLSKVKQSMHLYRDLPRSSERKLLFIRDICHPRIRNRLTIKLRLYLIFQFFILTLKPNFLPIIVREVWLRRKRRRFRNT